MSGGGSARRSLGARVLQLGALAVVLSLGWLASHTNDAHNSGAAIAAATGMLLLSGMLMSELLDVIGLPHLTGYLLAGLLCGPDVLHLVDHDAIEALAPVSTLALALIALAGGLELRIEDVMRSRKSLIYANTSQVLWLGVLMVPIFMLLARFMPFTSALAMPALLGVALLWAATAITRSPSATLGILSQTRARGPLAQYTLGFVMSSDVVVAAIMALVVSMVRPLVESGAEISMRDMQLLGHELLGSVALGTSLGLVLITYLKLIGRGILIVLLALGFVASDALRYIHFDPVLTFLSAGFVVQNLSAQGDKMLHAIEEAGSSVFIVFFATAGAHLKLDLLKALWPVALALCFARAAITWMAQQTASRLANDAPVVRRLGSLPLISQAGLTLGMGVIVERAFPSFGADFRALVIATVAVNELVGPVLFKLALDMAGETNRGTTSEDAQNAAN